MTLHVTHQHTLGDTAPADEMPGHWLLARLGKRVLRPGGLELSNQLLSALDIVSGDDVVEFAPGLGVTARLTLAREPQSYTAIERDAEAAATVKTYLHRPVDRCLIGGAEDTGLPDESASVVYGEAMLSMHPNRVKLQIIKEAARLLKPGGRYGIHELSLVPDGLDEAIRHDIKRDLTKAIHVGVRPLTVAEWQEMLASAGLHVTAVKQGPMHLLEPARVLRDEGLLRTIRFVSRLIGDAPARQRVLAMRRIFKTYEAHLGAVALVATKMDG